MLRTEKDDDFDQKLLVEQEKSFSECSSGCQSGWTLYLCQSQNIPASLHPRGDSDSSVHEEDLSMLSDASSGPPRVPKDDYINSYCCSGDVDGWPRTSFADNGGKRRRVEEQQHEQYSSLLDDTARSPLLRFSKTTSSNCSCMKLQLEDVSSDFSATHFKGKAAMHKLLDYTAPQNPSPICSQRKPL